jgi:hypothetical protein
MSCSINRYKFVGSCNKTKDTATAEGAKEMEARMKEMLAVREAQDGGNFKVRPSWDPIATKPNKETSTNSTSTTEIPTGTELKWHD